MTVRARRSRSGSLTLRLVVGAAVWTVVALVAGGILISRLFDDYLQSNLDSHLQAQLDSLIAASEIGPDGALQLERRLSEPRFDQVYSGRYWQISGPSGPVLRSRSLWDQNLDLGVPGRAGGVGLKTARGPAGQQLRLLVSDLTLPGSNRVFRFAVAADRAEVETQAERFTAALAWSLAGLGAGLIIAVLIQVRYGLDPLRRLRRALADIRAGRAERMQGRYPSEVAPLVGEVNALLDHNAEVVARARTHVGNLAHALKTPLSVLQNEAETGRPSAASVRQQTEAMRRHVDHYLSRGRAAAAGSVLGARTPVAEVARDLSRTLARIHRDRAPEIRVAVPEDAGFRGERQDLEEMIGNLMDNACKWAGGNVAVGATVLAGRLRVTVEDDGPGLPEAARAAAFERGGRLDEAVPGSGLGLAIVRDIAALYGGEVTLGKSEMGGLAVVLDLPAAAG